jgi:hypothetical protein
MMANVHTKQKAFKHHTVQLMDEPGLADKVRAKIDTHLEALNTARTDLFVEYADALPSRLLLDKGDPQALDRANEVFRVVIEAGTTINRQHKDLLDRRRSLDGLHPFEMRAILADPMLFQTDLWHVELKRGLSAIHTVECNPKTQELPKGHLERDLSNCPAGVFTIGNGVRGDQPGQFDFPSDVSVSHHKEVYVCDTINHRIQVFRTDGKFMRLWDVPQVKVPADPFKELPTCPVGVVVAPWDDVYVIKKNPRHVYVFHPDGSFRRTWKYTQGDERIPAACAAGVVFNSYGEVIVMCKLIRVFQPDGTFLRSWSLIDERPEGLCVAPSGSVYVVSKTTCHVYDRYGNELAAWEGLVDAAGVAVSSKGEVFVAEATGVRVFDTRGVFLRKCGSLKRACAVAVGSGGVFICRSDAHAIEVVRCEG